MARRRSYRSDVPHAQAQGVRPDRPGRDADHDQPARAVPTRRGGDMKCTKCGDEIAFEGDRQYWLGVQTGGECPAADVTLEELSGDLDVLLNGHTPEPEPEPV